MVGDLKQKAGQWFPMTSLTRYAKYLNLSHALKAQIQGGVYGPNGRLPTEQELSATYKVSRNTVRQAISLLESENYLVRRQGAGTFVADLAENGQPRRELTSLVMMVVDSVLQENAYYLSEMVTAEQWLSERGIAITSANLITRDLIRGRRPAALTQAHCQGLLLDGWVTDLHCAVMEELKLPYLVVGNHPVSAWVPQVRLDIKAIVGAMIDHLVATCPKQPIAMLLKASPTLQITQELLMAYMAAVQKLPQKGAILQMATEATSEAAINRMLDMQGQPFSLITTEAEVGAVVNAYRQRELSTERYPIVTFANPAALEPVERAYTHVMPHRGDLMIIEAITHFLAAYEQGRETIHELVGPRDIVPPSGA
ncbi:GntR family transcriptional regulator [Phycisphaerales bacterium AB-hyl4]|uniref:GntR family transcriptional regulator n=1 Tax=Natronomicrosphaera hydrolytica TaxID=3242702 RepID=A0ABV4U5N9_9BACT